MRVALLLLLSCAGLSAAEPLEGLQFLLGKWVAGSGAAEFTADLGGRVIVRRSFAAYGSGAARHDDLLVIFAENAAPKAVYFDNEGHVIRYAIQTPAPNKAIFESEAGQPGPRYRLTYELKDTRLDGAFEIAPPGAAYKPYLTWSTTRAKP
jgi:hypothetical protein